MPITPVVAASLRPAGLVKAKDVQPANVGVGGAGSLSEALGAQPVPAPLAPGVTATKTDSFPDPGGDGKAEPGQTITYTVQITNNGADAATGVTFTDLIGANITLVPGSVDATPVAIDDTFSAVGNVRISVPDGAGDLLSNDCNPDVGLCNGTGLTASGPTTSANGGNVTVNADGSFTYNPPPGFTGPDTFNYTITDGVSPTDEGTVTINVATMIWFVNAAAAADGDGRLTSPFNCYTGASAPGVRSCFSDTAADEAGDNIFLYSGNYTGGNTLLNNQRLIGQGASATLASITGATVPTHSDALPSTGGASPVLTTSVAATNAVNLGQGNTLRGFNVGNTTGAKIFGSNFGTLTVGNSTTPDVSLSGSGQALSLTTGTFAATSGFNGVATTSSAAQGVLLSTVAGTVAFGSTSVSGATTQGISVGSSTASINFGNTSVTGGTDAISLQNNSAGTRTFGTVTTSGNSGAGFLHSAGGGLVSVTGATSIVSPAGTGIQIANSNAAVSFAATSVDKGSTAGTAVSITNGGAQTTTFSSLDINSTNAAGVGLLATTGGTINVTNAAGSEITAPQLIDINVATLGLNFTQLASTNGPAATPAIRVSGAGGALASATTNLQGAGNFGISLSGNSAAFNFGNTTVNSSAGTGVFLNNNTGAVAFADLDISPDANQVAFNATGNSGTISSASGDIVTTGAAALNISGPAGRTPLSLTLNDISATNSATPGIDLNLVSGNITLASGGAGSEVNISNPTGIGIQIRNSGAGTLNFGDTVVTGAGGSSVVLGTASNGNSANITFSDLDITTPDASQRGLIATHNTGVITVTTGSISSGTGAIAVEIVGQAAGTRTPLNIQLERIDANGNNTAASGLVLTNTSASGSPGGFRVLGTGTTDGSGGTIQNTTTRGASINTVDSLLLRNMNFTSANSTVDAGAGGVCDDLNTVNCNAAIYLNGVTTLATLDNLNVTGTMVENGINALNVANFKLDNSLLDGCGNDANQEVCVKAQNLSGTSTVNGTEIRFSETESFVVINTDVNWNLTMSGTTIRDTQTVSAGGGANINGEGGFSFRSFSVAAGQPVTTINILNSSFLRLRTQAIQPFADDDTILNIDITGCTIDAGADIGTGIDLNGNDLATVNFNITGNPTIQSRGGAAVNITSFLDANVEGRVNSNPDIEVLGGPGIPVRLVAQETSNMIVEVNGNTVSNANGTEDTAIDVQSRFQTARVDATITGNTVRGEPTGVAGINLISGSSTPGESNITCGDVANNNVANAAANSLDAFRIRVSDVSNTNRLFLEGFIDGGPTAAQDVEATWSGRGNTPTGVSEVNASLTGTAVAPSAPPGGVCLAVDTPTDHLAPAEVTDSIASVSPPVVQDDAAPDDFTPDNVTGSEFVAQMLAAAQPFVTGVSKRDGGTTLRYTAADAPLRVESFEAERVAERETEDAPRAVNASFEPAPVRTAALTGETVSVQIGTLPAGETVTITFQVTINNPLPSGTTQVSNQGTVSGSNFSSVLTDDPDTVALNDPTVTPVLAPPDIKVNDAKVVEPTSGTADALFTVTLSHPYSSAVTVDFATAEDAPPGAGKATAGSDYTTTNGTVTFPAGETFRTITVPVLTDGSGEPDETFLVNLSSPTNGTITDGQAVGTITETRTPGAVLISELRTSGPGGVGDDFVELYNNGDSPAAIGGWSLVKSGAGCDAAPVVVANIPAGTMIPARGNYLLGGIAYSLGAYAGADQTLTEDIEADRNVALFNTSDATALGSTTVVDAVGFGANTGSNCDLLREGNTLTGAANDASQYSFVREVEQGATADSGDNAADFALVSTTPAVLINGVTPLLGAPGPESSTKPVGPAPCAANPTYEIGRALLDTAVDAGAEPNRKRDATPDAPSNSTFGTIEFRRTFTNNTGGSLTALRFRIVDLTTLNSPGGPQADLRARSSSAGTVTLSDTTTMVSVGGTTLEQPPTQSSGGGVNSSLAVASGLPLADGASANLRFLFGVQTTGNYRVGFVIETLSSTGAIGQDIWVLTGHTETGGDAERACNAPPDVDAGDDQTVECAGASTTVTLSGTATDPEGDTPLTFEWFEGNTSLGTGETLENVMLTAGQHTITLKVTDSQGNVGEDTVVVNVVDTTGPTFVTTPTPVTLQTGAGAASCSVTVSDLDATLGTATATDSCGGNNVTVERLGVPAGNVFPIGETIVTYKATDASGNMATFMQTVTVVDNTVPTITPPANLTDVGTDAGSCVATNVNLGTPTTGDNCPLPPDAVTNDAPASFPLGTTTVTWKVTDAAGSMATATQTVTVVDKEKPSVTAPAPVTLQTGAGATSCSVTVSNLDATLGTATTADNCSGAVTVERLVGATVITSPHTFPVGPTTVTYRATDAAGNTQTSTQVVTVEDNTAPVISCPANIFTPPSGGNSASVPFSVTATDNCGGATVVSRIGATVITSPHTFPVGTTTVDSTATDTAGNTSSCSFTVTVGSGTVTVVAAVTGQYSDSVNLQATVTPIVSIPGSPLTGNVQFFVNGTSVGTVAVPSGGGIASLPYLLTQAAGTYNITAQFTSTNPNYLSSAGGPAILTVNKELAATAYTGDESILTAGPSITTATVRLAAHLTQEADGSPGDITLARVRFYLFKSTNLSNTPDLIVPALASDGLTPDASGDVLTTVNLAADTWMVKVKIEPTNMYWKHSNVAIGVLNITTPTNEQRSNGGGWVPDAASADGKGHFGFTVSLGGGKNPALKGNSTFFFHGLDGFDYLVKGNSWQGGYLQFSAEPGVNPSVFTRSNFKGRCNVQKIDPATGEVVQSFGNFIFEVFTKDGDLLTPKQPDAYSITVWDGNVVFHQVGSRTSLVTLGGGNITNKNK